MDCVRHDWDRIDRITDTMLFYRDDRGDLIPIDLKKCRDRYLKHLNAHLEDYPSRNSVPVQADDDFRCVGDCFFDGTGGAYFEFYDWPHIRFEKRLKNTPGRRILRLLGVHWTQKYYDEFLGIQCQLEKAGWSTYGLN